jgi:hypothetical protein
MTDPDLKVEIAAMRGEVITKLEHLSHEMRNLKQTLTSFVTLREFAENVDRRKEAHTDLEHRVERLEEAKEEFRNRILWLFLSQGGVLAGGLLLWKLTGHFPG